MSDTVRIVWILATTFLMFSLGSCWMWTTHDSDKAGERQQMREHVVQMVEAGANPIDARCSVEEDMSRECVYNKLVDGGTNPIIAACSVYGTFGGQYCDKDDLAGWLESYRNGNINEASIVP